jgi:hypothetical protein
MINPIGISKLRPSDCYEICLVMFNQPGGPPLSFNLIYHNDRDPYMFFNLSSAVNDPVEFKIFSSP